MGIHWVDRNWVLAIYSVGVQSKYPVNLRQLLVVVCTGTRFYRRTSYLRSIDIP